MERGGAQLGEQGRRRVVRDTNRISGFLANHADYAQPRSLGEEAELWQIGGEKTAGGRNWLL